MARAGLNLERVLQAAATIVDAEGLECLTIAQLATSLGVKPPSLYNHVASLDRLKDALTHRAVLLLLDSSRDSLAGVAGQDALNALGHSQRQFARAHPGLWATMQLPITGWGEATQSAADAYLSLVLAVLRGYGATGDSAVHAARVIRASLRGFIDLELGGGFGLPQDVDVSFSILLKMMHTSLKSYKTELGKRSRKK
jgi:AcrR family transcriptional regulator